MSLPDVTEVVADDLRRRRALWLLVPVVTVSGYLLWGWQSGTFAADEQGKGAVSTSRTVTGSTESLAAARDTGLRLRAGSVEGLAPGVAKTVRVQITNDDADPVRLDRVDGVVSSAGLPDGCAADALVVAPFAAPPAEAALAPGASREVAVSVSMPETGRNQDACKRARFSITFNATGTTR